LGDLRETFASLVLQWLTDDVIHEFSPSLDMERSGIAVLARLQDHFVDARPQPDSPEEVFHATMRLRRSDFKSTGEYLACVQRALLVLPRTTPDGSRNLFAERLLCLRVFSELREPAWLSSLAADVRKNLRSERADVPAHGLRAVCQQILYLCPPTSSGPSRNGDVPTNTGSGSSSEDRGSSRRPTGNPRVAMITAAEQAEHDERYAGLY
jgi:hypothetical protein